MAFRNSITQSHFINYICLAILTLFICLLPYIAIAEVSSSKAPVVLDGRILFEVGNFGSFPAQERANQINLALLETVKNSDPINIEVLEVDRQITLKETYSQRHLLTVTQGDTISAATPYDQAILWKNILEIALEKGQQERQPIYQIKSLLLTGTIILITILLYLSLQLLRSFGSRKLSYFLNNLPHLEPWNKLIIQWWQILVLGLQLGIWIFSIIYITNLFPQSRSWRYWLNSPLITLADKAYSPLELIVLILLTISVWFIVRSFTNLLKKHILKRISPEQEIQEIITVLTQYVLTFLGLIILWQSWGLDVGALAITASVLGVGIGFGLQNIANNFISGLIILLERPIKIGDLIKVDDLIGTVQSIGFRSTEIVTPDSISIIIPNSQILENQVINWNHSQSISRIRIPVGVSYNSEPRKVKTALLYAAKSHSEVLQTPRPQVWLQEFADSSLNFELLVWIKEPKKQFRIKSDLNYLIAASLRRYHIEIPFPQRDINFNSPKLEQLLIAWLNYQGINPRLFENNTNELTDKLPKSKVSKNEDFFSPIEDNLTGVNFDELIEIMRSVDGLDIQDRRYYLNVYPSCFVGSEAVDWLVKKQNYKREEAVELGQIMMEKGIIHHVTDEHSFKDGYFFYRFYVDE